MTQDLCHCGSGKPYADCCRPYHQRKAQPPTAEVLMRSRYCAYVLGDAKYLYRSWDEATRPSLQSLRAMPPVQWLGLTIRATGGGSEDDETGTVSFVARYLDGGRVVEMRETSRFRRVAGRWVYVDGDIGG